MIYFQCFKFEYKINVLMFNVCMLSTNKKKNWKIMSDRFFTNIENSTFTLFYILRIFFLNFE